MPPSPRPIITLTTDFGLDDWYVASMKGVLLARCPDARLIDVTHRITQGDVLCGSISLERAIDGFPGGTIHLAVVDPGVGSVRRMLIARIKNQWVIAPDNGLITWSARRHSLGDVYELTWRPRGSSNTFHGRDIMGPAAAMLAAGEPVENLGRRMTDPVLLDVAPVGVPSREGRIIHIDHFGNATTNILAEAVHATTDPHVVVNGRPLGALHRTYTDVPPGQALPLIGSSGLLEIAVRDGSAAEELGLTTNDVVTVTSGGEVHSKIEHRKSKIPTETLQSLDKQHIWHPFTPMSLWLDSDPLVITAAEGMHLIDSDGSRYLDAVSSLWCNVHGHRVPEIDEAVRAQLDKVAHSTMLGLSNEPAILLADALMRIVPPNLKKVFYSDSGATATEVAFKLAVQYWYNVGKPEKTEFIAFSEAYHGDTFGAMSVGRTTAFHKPYFPMLFKVHYAPTPYTYRYLPSPSGRGQGEGGGERRSGWLTAEEVRNDALRQLESLLKEHANRVAAISIEPVVQGAAGMIVQPDGFLREVRRLATEYDVLLICDEVATGFGRTGRMFAVEHEGVRPDLMCAAKGITGGYLPLAATFATQPIFDAFLGPPRALRTFFHGHTYTGNPLACAAAIASLELFEKNDLLTHVRRTSEQLARMLDELRPLPHVGDVRQKGLMVGIELVKDKETRESFDPSLRLAHQICFNLRKRGILMRPLGDVLVLMPPLAMPVTDLQSIVNALAEELRRM